MPFLERIIILCKYKSTYFSHNALSGYKMSYHVLPRERAILKLLYFENKKSY